MAEFKLIPVETSEEASQKIYLLEIDGETPFINFEKKMRRAGMRRELAKIREHFESLASGLLVPPNSIKTIKGKQTEDDWKEFELRQKSLRVYFFIIPPDGKVVVLGEYKKGSKEQRKTIERFQYLKSEFKLFYQNKLEEE